MVNFVINLGSLSFSRTMLHGGLSFAALSTFNLQHGLGNWIAEGAYTFRQLFGSTARRSTLTKDVFDIYPHFLKFLQEMQ
jgi:hypothetical protein